MGASLSNPHFLAFADAYNKAEDAGRQPLYWSQFLDTRTFGAGEDVAELRSWNMNLHVEQMVLWSAHVDIQMQNTDTEESLIFKLCVHLVVKLLET